MVGLLRDKAVLIIDGGRPKTMAVGSSAHGITLLAIEGNVAVIENEGKRQKIVLGQQTASRGEGAAATLSLNPDSRGHYRTEGSINGAYVNFVVDTGATLVSMGAADAKRAGIDFRSGQATTAVTSAGNVRAWKVRIDSIKVGSITLHGVDGVVMENDLPMILLGMSFLSRMEIKQDGETLILRKRY